MAEDEMIGWHHRVYGHEFEQAPEVGVEQGILACCSPWGCKELDMTEQSKNNKYVHIHRFCRCKQPSYSTEDPFRKKKLAYVCGYFLCNNDA